MEVEDRHDRVGPLNDRFFIRDILAIKCSAPGSSRFRRSRRRLLLPLERDAAEIRLVADLEVEVVKLVQLPDHFADKGFLEFLEILNTSKCMPRSA